MTFVCNTGVKIALGCSEKRWVNLVNATLNTQKENAHVHLLKHLIPRKDCILKGRRAAFIHKMIGCAHVACIMRG